MRLRAVAATLSTAALALSGALLAVPATASAAPPVTELSGTLTERGTDMPATSNAAQQIASGSVVAYPQSDRTTATVTLRAEPSAADDARLWVILGQYSGSGANKTCHAVIDYSTPTAGELYRGWTRSGATYTLDSSLDPFGSPGVADNLDCAFAVVTDLDDQSQLHDILGGDLGTTLDETTLRIERATLLGSPKLKLLPGEWITVDVTVRNTGPHDTDALVVTGKGKALKVKRATSNTTIYSSSTSTIPVKVKLTKKRKSTLTLTAKAAGAKKVTTKVKVKPAKAPKRIRNGSYAGDGKFVHVKFRVKKGKLTKFEIEVWTTCSGTGYWMPFQLKPIRVPRSGIINVTETDPLYIAKLSGRAAGTKLTNARFSYTGSGCFANQEFSASRVR